MRKLIEMFKNLRITLLSCRRSLTNAHTFQLHQQGQDFCDYQFTESQLLQIAQLRVIQAESLHKLGDQTENLESDLLIIDEMEGFITQMCSHQTQKTRMKSNFVILKDLVRLSKKHLFLDHNHKRTSSV